jgi:hypothetical protein
MQYFKHMSNMRNDIKIKRLISKHGLAGYGLYNLILESIVEGITTENPIPDLHETCDDIALFYNGNAAQINEMAAFMLNQGLLEIDEITGRILCRKIYKFLEQSQTRSEDIRNLINTYKTRGLLPVSQTVSDSQRPSKTNMKEQEEEQEQEIEQEQNKNNILIEKQQAFEEFWTLYDKKVGKESAKKQWLKINPEIYPIIFAHIELYKKEKPDKTFRKDPERYLKYNCWLDEVACQTGEKKESVMDIKKRLEERYQ